MRWKFILGIKKLIMLFLIIGTLLVSVNFSLATDNEKQSNTNIVKADKSVKIVHKLLKSDQSHKIADSSNKKKVNQSKKIVDSSNKKMVNHSKKIVDSSKKKKVNPSKKKITNSSKMKIAESEYIVINEFKKSYKPRLVKYNSKELISKAKCSCGKKGYSKFHSTKFENFCVCCKKNGQLIFRDHYEGEWTCKACGADYCLATGKVKLSHSKKFLNNID